MDELDIQIRDDIFVYKLYDNRDTFPFSIVCLPNLSSNIPSNIFYGAVFSELLQIAGQHCYLTILYQMLLSYIKGCAHKVDQKPN